MSADVQSVSPPSGNEVSGKLSVLCVSFVRPVVALLGVAVETSASARDATPQTKLYLRLSN